MNSLHAHTGYSSASLGFPDSSIKIDDLVKRAKEKGLNGIAFTEHELLGNHIKALEAGEKHDMNVILGNEIYLVDSWQYDKLKEDYDPETMYFPHFLLIALDNKGHEQLRELSTRAWIDNSFHKSGIIRRPTKISDLYEVINGDTGHLIASTACLGGQVSKWVWSKLNTSDDDSLRDEQIDEYIAEMKHIFGEDNFFIELQPPLRKDHQQNLVNKELVKVAKRTNTEMIVTTDVHYLDKKLYNLHENLLNSSNDNDEDYGRDLKEIYGTAYLMSEEEVKSYFEKVDFDMTVIERAIKNTDKIGKKVKGYDLTQSQKVPTIPKPNNFNIKDNFFPNKGVFKDIMESDNIDDQFLLYRLQEGMIRNTDFIDYDETIERLETELTEIRVISEGLNQALGNYFTTMEKIINIIWNDGDSIVGVGRGSCVSSVMSFLLDITQLNPLKMPVEMPFYRFITEERPELPDCSCVFTIIQSYSIVI